MTTRYVFALLLIALSPTGFAQKEWSAGGYFQRDPYLPVRNWDDEARNLKDFRLYAGPDAKPVQDEALVKQANEMIAEVYAGYQKAFPHFMQNKEMPRVLIREEESPYDAVSVTNTRPSENHGTVIVGTKFLTSKYSVDAKMGMLAHELAHLYFGDDGRETKYAYRVHYASGKNISESEISAFQLWLDLSQPLGGILLVESGGVTRNSSLGRYMERAMDEIEASKNPKCGKEVLNKVGWKMVDMLKLFSNFDYDFVLDKPEKKKTIVQDSSEMERLVLDCAREENLSPIRIPSDVRDVYDRFNIAQDLPWDTGFTWEQFFRAAREGKERLRDLATQFDLADIRYSSYEDRADEAAVAVMKTLKLDPLTLGESLLDALYQDKDRCLAVIAKGEVPPFGTPHDLHHSICFRYYQFKKFASEPSHIPLD